MARFSAIIPTYNRAALIGRAVASALEQTLPPDEVIVVDDGSSDDTPEVLGRFGDRVRYVYQANAGVAVARNRGADVAEHPWLAFLDSDDLWMPDYLERISKAIEHTEGHADTYFMDLGVEGSDQTVWQRSGFEIDGAFELSDEPAEWFMRALQPMTTQTTVIRRDAYRRVGGQQPGILCRQDTHLFFLLGLTGASCAVQGLGAILGDSGDERLTAVHASQTFSYCQDTIALYGDVLRRHRPHLSRNHRRELRRRLARAHWHHAKLELRQHPPAASVAIARSLTTSPGVLLGKVIRGPEASRVANAER